MSDFCLRMRKNVKGAIIQFDVIVLFDYFIYIYIMTNSFDIKKYKQSSKNGGASLAKIAAKFSKLKANDENRRKVEHFLLDVYKFLHETKYLAQQRYG